MSTDPFFVWLGQQTRRTDAVASLALAFRDSDLDPLTAVSLPAWRQIYRVARAEFEGQQQRSNGQQRRASEAEQARQSPDSDKCPLCRKRTTDTDVGVLVSGGARQRWHADCWRRSDAGDIIRRREQRKAGRRKVRTAKASGPAAERERHRWP